MAILPVKEVVRRLLVQYPALYRDKADCYAFLFLKPHNGYRWSEGGLVEVGFVQDTFAVVWPRSSVNQQDDDQPRWADEDIPPPIAEWNVETQAWEDVVESEADKRLREQRIACAKAQNEQIRFVLENFEAIYTESVAFSGPVSISPDSLLLSMPADADEDWREACMETIEAVKHAEVTV